MKIDESVLRAYVDAELAPEQRDQIEAVLAHNAELRAQVQALRASRLPYRAAFDAEALPPMPMAIAAQVASWTALAPSAPPHRFGAPLGRRRWLGLGAGVGMGLAASFAAGLFLRLPQGHGGMDMPSSSPWVSAIANYQALYVRATVDQPPDDSARIQWVLGDFAATTRTAIAIPDLQSAGLTFKRIQRLGYEDKPLLQMIFLAAQGKPTALCLLPVERQDAAIQQSELQGMQVVSWQRSGMSYVLVTELPAHQAKALADKLLAGGYPAIYGA
jgi:anti-sigma factor RsiW